MRGKKKLAARILKTSITKVTFAADALEDIKKAITRSDLRGLIAIGKISKSSANQHSRVRARKLAAQKRKGRKKGPGKRRGTKNARLTQKERRIMDMRSQRAFLKLMRKKSLLSPHNYRKLYAKSRGGYFRNRRHIKLYIGEHNLIEQKK
jgi:large subunit ribosomal protein L19e